MASNNFFFSGTDPLLSGSQFDKQFNEIAQMEQAIAQRKQALLQAKGQVMQQGATQQQSQSPVWDEIETIVSAMSDKEYEIVTNNDEFIESQHAITAILNAKYMQLMKPIVEGCAEGKDALEKHLTLVKRLRKSAAGALDKEMSDFNDYRENYSHMTYDDYLKQKNSKKTKK